MSNHQDSLGFVETHGLVAAIEVADAMVKAAEVTIEAAHKVDAGLVCVICRGDLASCKAAVDVGTDVAARLGCLAGANVIARPADEDVSLLAPLADINARKSARKAARKARTARSNSATDAGGATATPEAPMAAATTLNNPAQPAAEQANSSAKAAAKVSKGDKPKKSGSKPKK